MLSVGVGAGGLAMDELEELRLRAVVKVQTDAADAAAEAVGNMAEKLSALLAERDRLRAVVDAVVAQFGGLHDLFGETVKLNVEDLLALHDQAQAALDVSPTMGRCPDCGNPDRYCDCPDRTPNIGDAPPPDAPRALDLVADVLHDAFKGATDVDLDLLAADVIDALQGRALSVELRWFDGLPGTTDEGVVVLGRHMGEPIARCPHCGAGPEGGSDCPLCRALDPLRSIPRGPAGASTRSGPGRRGQGAPHAVPWRLWSP
jgi:hypothetical protein